MNYECGERVEIPIHVSNYAHDIEKATLRIMLTDGKRVWLRREIRTGMLPCGEITELYRFAFNMPRSEKPLMLKLIVRLSAPDLEIDNEWELFAFPKAAKMPTKAALLSSGLKICSDISETELLNAMNAGESVLLFGNGPFAVLDTSFQIALAGRTAGHLGTVIGDSALMQDFPHEGFCSWQFRSMLDGGKSAVIDFADIPFDPIIESVSTYKYARREALIFEYKVGKGKLLVCTLNLDERDAGARYLKFHIIEYAMSEEFSPKLALTQDQLERLFNTNPVYVAKNTNLARNTNDPTM